ncbi:MAG: glycoside hydrolase family 172 protein, partial [Pseudomonadota bacterium]
ITLASLLREMLDRDRLARLTEPSYTTGQASSYDRASVAPDQPGWFANNDTGVYIRKEVVSGRTEYVMMDVDGPGVIDRWWKGDSDPTGTIRVYLDGEAAPAIEWNVITLLNGQGPVTPPLAAEKSLGLNFYLPIPYAKHCKVTFDKPGLHWYNIEHRIYPVGTRVQTFSLADLQAQNALVQQVQASLTPPVNEATLGITRTLPAQQKQLGAGESVQMTLQGPAAIRELTVAVSAPNMTDALRATVLDMSCDGEQLIWAPVGDFFGSGVGLNPYRDFYRWVASDGTMKSYWVMPFAQTCRVGLTNVGSQKVVATLGAIGMSDWTWNSQSLLFHSHWRQEYPIHTKAQAGTTDWNFITITGAGHYVGDTLALYNGSSAWWGEGDEKIWVDDDKFPSHFGTGTEDYYGYSYGDRGVFFEGPFVAAPLANGNNKPGHTTNTRTRNLDIIPFTKSLTFNLEIWHWGATDVAYAAATYFYARPGAVTNRPPLSSEAARPVPPGP